jgi:hypothetical protein
MLEPGMQLEGLSLDQQILEQVALQPVKPSFQFVPFEPGLHVEPATFVEVQLT